MSGATLSNVSHGKHLPPADPIEALLRELVAEVRGLREDFKLRSALRLSATVLTRDDGALLARLLPAIAGALGSDPFLARDLFVDGSAGLRLVLRGLNAKRIGRLFQRAEGHAVDGYVVERAGVELHAVLWRVVQAVGFPEE